MCGVSRPEVFDFATGCSLTKLCSDSFRAAMPAGRSETTGRPAAHSKTAGGRARRPVEDDPKLSTGSTSTWKSPGRRAPWEHPVENSRRGGRALEPAGGSRTTGSRASSLVEDARGVVPGTKSTRRLPGGGPWDNIRWNTTGRGATSTRRRPDGWRVKQAEDQAILCNLALVVFRRHFDRAARALLGAQSAALAVIVIKAVALAGPQLQHRILLANSNAVVALKAVPAGHTSARFK